MAVSIESIFLKKLTQAFFTADSPLLTPPADLNWHRLISLGQEHEVASTLFPLIDQTGLPDVIKQALNLTIEEARRRTTLLLLELERILPLLVKAGCEPVLLKGVPLALAAYASPTQRYFRDIDILVDTDRVETACTVLTELGYQLMTSDRDPRWYRDYHFHWVMQNQAGTIIEVHWDLTLRESIYGTDLPRIAQEATLLPIGKASARIPQLSDILLHMVLQAISAGFTSLKHIVDGGLLVAKVDDWPALVQQARACNLGTGLWFLLDMVAEITGVKAPDEVMAALQPGGLSRRIWSKLQQSELCLDRLVARSHAYHFFLHWLCAPNNRLRLREIGRYLFPSEGGLLEAGFRTDTWPGFWQRATLSLSRIKMFFSIMGMGLYWASRPLNPSAANDL